MTADVRAATFPPHIPYRRRVGVFHRLGIVRAVNEAKRSAAGPARSRFQSPSERSDSPGTEVVEAEIAFPSVKFQSSYGLHEFHTEKVKEISIDKVDANEIHAGIELDDGNPVSTGHCRWRNCLSAWAAKNANSFQRKE